MRKRFLSVAALSTAFLLGVVVRVAPAADETPKDQSTTEQPKADKPQPANREGFPLLDRVYKAVKELKLSDEVSAKVDKYFDDARGQIKKIREDASGDRQEMMQKGREVMEKLRDNVAGVLTEDQKQELKTKIQDAVRQGAGDPLARIKAAVGKLTLTDDQKEKLEKLKDEVEAKIADIKSSGGGMEKFRELMQDTKKKVLDALTDEQKEKFNALMKPNAQ